MARKSVTPESALQTIRSGKIPPVSFFYGDEMFLAEELQEAIVQATFGSAVDDFNYHVYDGKESDAGSIVTTAMSFPMLAESKVVVVKNADQMHKDERDALMGYLSRPLESTRLVLLSPKPDFRVNPFKWLKEHAWTVECSRIDESEFPERILTMAKAKGKSVEPQAARLLAARSDLSLRDIQTEIEKLTTYVGSRDEITEEDVETVCGVSRQNNVFELCRAVGNRDFVTAVGVLRNMLTHGESPVGMIAMLYRHLSILWTICDWREARQSERDIQSQLQTAYRVFPNFYHQDYAPQAQGFRAEHLSRCLEWLAETDSQLKSSSVRDELLMEMLLFRLTHPEVDA